MMNISNVVRLVVASVLACSIVLVANPASATTPTEFCRIMTYRIDPSAQTDYGRTIVRAQRMISEFTGIRFVNVGASWAADFSYVQHPEAALRPWGDHFVVGENDGKIVRLSTQGKQVRLGLVLHETLHAVGVQHVAEPDSVMSAPYTWVSVFSDADKAAMRGVSCFGGQS